MNIPQVLGYTRIAGTPVVTGLYTVLLPLIAFAVFGSSRHLVVAADSATAAIFSGALSQMAPLGSDRYMALVGMLTLETAGVLLLARIFKAGFLADFLSRTVLVGFLTGVGVQVGVAMLGDMLGVAVASRHTAVQLWEVARAAPSARRPRRWRVDLRRGEHSLWLAGSRPAFRRRWSWLSARSRRAPGSISPGAALPVIGPVPGRAAVAQVAGRELERYAGADPGRRLVLRDDHRPERGDGAQLCGQASRARRRERRHPRALGRQRRRGAERRVRGQRQPDPDGDGGRGGGAEPGRATRLRRRRRRRARVPDRPAAIPAALRSGEHRVHHRRRHDRRRGPRAIRRESRGEFLLALFTAARGAGDRRRAGHPAGDRGLARAPRPPQLPAVRDGARPRRPGAVGAGRSGPDDRSRAHRLPVRRRPLLRQRRPLRRRGARPRRRRARAGPMVHHRLRARSSTSTIPPPGPSATSSTN